MLGNNLELSSIFQDVSFLDDGSHVDCYRQFKGVVNVVNPYNSPSGISEVVNDYRSKMRETEAYCSELERKNDNVEQILKAKNKELEMSLRRNENEMSEWSLRTADLRDENASLKNEISKRDVFEQTLLRENKNKTGVAFSEEVREHLAGPSVINDGTGDKSTTGSQSSDAYPVQTEPTIAREIFTASGASNAAEA